MTDIPVVPLSVNSLTLTGKLQAAGVDQKTAAAIGKVLKEMFHKQAVDERLNYRAIEEWANGLTVGSPISKAIVNAKGDTVVATADNTVDRLPVGANGTFLIADSSTTTGLIWRVVAAGDITFHTGAADPHTGYVLESLLDAKGDIYAASAADVPAKVTVGANGRVLTADSAQATGLRYADKALHTVTTPADQDSGILFWVSV